jgi:uncharacterized protein (TIGR00661 family)
MKIFYAIQATGNGHISRAVELMPYLEKYGTVDVFLSGSNCNLKAPFNVKYKSKGLSLFYGNSGGLDYFKMLKAFSPLQIIKEAKNLPLKKYDVVINDFESITSLACKIQRVPSVHFGHQASFISKATPRPAKKDILGEMVLKYYATGTKHIGLHFSNYDNFIYSPILKKSILQATPVNKEHITVYLSHYSKNVVVKALENVKNITFHVFTKEVQAITYHNNIILFPINNESFTASMIASNGVITGAGFETPAEALYLGKKLLCLPIKGQYEQLCNAAALKNFNVTILDTIDANFAFEVKKWLMALPPKPLILNNSTEQIVETVMHTALLQKPAKNYYLDNVLDATDVAWLPGLI